jgi:hypothetical protein
MADEYHTETTDAFSRPQPALLKRAAQHIGPVV